MPEIVIKCFVYCKLTLLTSTIVDYSLLVFAVPSH